MDVLSYALAKNYADERTSAESTLIAKTEDDIYAMLDVIEANGGGTLKLVPYKTYTISETIFLPDNTTLEGADGSMITLVDNCPLTGVQLETAATGSIPIAVRNIHPIIANKQYPDRRSQNITIKNIKIRGNSANQPQDRSFAGIFFHKADGCKVLDCDVFDIIADKPAGWRGFCILTIYVYNILIQGGRYGDAGYDGIGIRDGSVGVDVVGAEVHPCGQANIQTVGDWLRNGDFNTGITIKDCKLTQSDHSPCIINHRSHSVTIDNCLMESLSYGISVLDGGKDITITNNTIHSDKSAFYIYKMYEEEDIPEKIIIANNRAVVTSSIVCNIMPGKHVTVEGNIFRQVGAERAINTGAATEDRGGEQAEGIVIKSNILQSVSSGTVRLHHGTKRVVFVGNEVICESSRGIIINAETEDVIVRDNDFTETTGITNSSTGTNIIIADNFGPV